MAEYFVNPNVSHMPTASMGQMVSSAPAALSMNAPANLPSPTMVSPAYAKPAFSYGCGYGHGLSAEAILVLFILLVIIARTCG